MRQVCGVTLSTMSGMARHDPQALNSISEVVRKQVKSGTLLSLFLPNLFAVASLLTEKGMATERHFPYQIHAGHHPSPEKKRAQSTCETGHTCSGTLY